VGPLDVGLDRGVTVTAKMVCGHAPPSDKTAPAGKGDRSVPLFTYSSYLPTVQYSRVVISMPPRCPLTVANRAYRGWYESYLLCSAFP